MCVCVCARARANECTCVCVCACVRACVRALFIVDLGLYDTDARGECQTFHVAAAIPIDLLHPVLPLALSWYARDLRWWVKGVYERVAGRLYEIEIEPVLPAAHP